MKKILISLLLAISLLSVACSVPSTKEAEKKTETANEEKTEEKDKADDKAEEKDDKKEAGDMKDKVNIKYFDEFKDDEILAIANVTYNNDKEDLFAAYNVKELRLSENDDAKEYLIIPKDDKTDLVIKSSDSEGDGESFTLGKKFGLKLAISDSDLDKFVFTVKNGDKTKDFSFKLKEDGGLDLDKEIMEVVFK